MFEFMYREQIPLFKELFDKQEFEVPSVDYQVWLLYKRQALGTEAEAIQRVASSRIPSSIPRSVTKRANNLPPGPDRYDVTSEPFIQASVNILPRLQKKNRSFEQKIAGKMRNLAT